MNRVIEALIWGFLVPFLFLILLSSCSPVDTNFINSSMPSLVRLEESAKNLSELAAYLQGHYDLSPDSLVEVKKHSDRYYVYHQAAVNYMAVGAEVAFDEALKLAFDEIVTAKEILEAAAREAIEVRKKLGDQI